MKQIYSLNMICYLRCEGFNEINVGFNQNTCNVYFEFEDSEDVQSAIKKYREPDTTINLHKFITEFRDLKQEIYMYSKKFNGK